MFNFSPCKKYFSCISNSKYSATNRVFLLQNWKSMQLKNTPAKVYEARHTFNMLFGVFSVCYKGLQLLICPNFPRNSKVLFFLETFNTFIKLSDTRVKL